MGEETDVEPGAGQRRMIHTRLRCEDEQRTFDFARKDTIIYTTLGLGGPINRRLEKAGKESLLGTPSLAELHHGRVHVDPGLLTRIMPMTVALRDPSSETSRPSIGSSGARRSRFVPIRH
jgi:hypothetical protein